MALYKRFLEASWLALPLRPVAALGQEQESGMCGGEARGGGRLGTMTDLLLRQVEARAGAERPDDYDVIGPDGLVIGRIFKTTTAPAETPWIWTLTRGEHEDHGHERTREAAMAAFAKSWRRE